MDVGAAARRLEALHPAAVGEADLLQSSFTRQHAKGSSFLNEFTKFRDFFCLFVLFQEIKKRVRPLRSELDGGLCVGKHLHSRVNIYKTRAEGKRLLGARPREEMCVCCVYGPSVTGVPLSIKRHLAVIFHSAL